VHEYQIQAIGVIHSPYKEKFGTPRQSGLIPVQSKIELFSPYNQIEAFKEIKGFSHIWINFVFHQALSNQWKPQVRPPRLGGNEKVGVFASRSPFRPNNLGQSVVRFIGIEQKQKKLIVVIEGGDLIDGTPIVDIKPYIPYVDSILTASGGFAGKSPEATLQVGFSTEAEKQLALIPNDQEFKRFLEQVLSLDPRPAYKNIQDTHEYGLNLDGYNIRWQVNNSQIQVMSILPVTV